MSAERSMVQEQPVGAGGLRPDRAVDRQAGDYRGESYYGRPAVKPSLYGWRVAAYIFLGGMAGAAQIISTLADLLRWPRAGKLVARGRSLALGNAAAGAILLIADLHVPQRFFNMLRIFRRSSPMSIGTYVLSSFGAFSGLAKIAEWLGWVRAARISQVPAAVAGAGMTSYTGALLGATATPLWAAEPRLLTARFASASFASAAAALSLWQRLAGEGESCRTLDRLAMTAAGLELALTIEEQRRCRARGLASVLRERPWGPVHDLSVGLGAALPVALYAASQGGRRRDSGQLSVLASLGVLAGGLLMRSAVLHAGNESAMRPADYFRLAQPANDAKRFNRAGRR
jgi:formate-dependent nitrite reductase membrane component NrfD